MHVVGLGRQRDGKVDERRQGLVQHHPLLPVNGGQMLRQVVQVQVVVLPEPKKNISAINLIYIDQCYLQKFSFDCSNKFV